MTSSTNSIREAFLRDGYVFPIPVMSEEQAADYRAQLEDFEATIGREQKYRRCLRKYPNLVLPFVDEISRLPAVVDAVAEILGPDLLALDTPFFIKEPRSEAYVSWHQDLHYWGLEGEDADEVTAWIALSPVTPENGCMRFVPGSHNQIVEHKDTYAENNLLSHGQELAVEVDESEAIDCVLQPGEMSLHHGRLFHGSHANHSDGRRIAIAIRYLATRMKQAGEATMAAMLVRGEDRFGHFRPCRRPAGTMQPDDYAHWLDVAGARYGTIMPEGRSAD